MSQKCRQEKFFTIIFPLHRVYVSLDPSASVSESKRWSTQMMSVRWKEQWCYQILPLYVYSLVSAVITYIKFINIYCSLCTKTESSSLVKCSIRFFLSWIWEIQPRVSTETTKHGNVKLTSISSVTLCMYCQNLWNGRGQLTQTFEKTMDWNFSYGKCIFNPPKRI